MTELAESTQDWEAAWWNGATNTFGEEAKQITYAHRMGLTNEPRDGRWPVYDLAGRSVLDLGGGPVSMLLKCVNPGACTVVDPCPYPKWVRRRYREADIGLVRETAEEFKDAPIYDEAWCYNVLQHVEDPEKVIATARRLSPALRIFEWIEMPPCEGHPHTLHASDLNDWIGGDGTVEYVNENGAVGLAYYGRFDV